ncbi:hypothetical protein EYC80_004979 [Monilinia laxa]|uniref:Uncharacterized protein n=1 Tax=Monilinia laxa TaxID=61186 RepID=A0A5N6KIT5_MONLA|nr:hypothetical protein EYC80_004979 [Monilinia laxa]
MKRGNDISTFLEYRSERDIDIDDPRVLIEVDEDEDEAEIDLHTCDHYKPNSDEEGKCSRRNSHKCLLLAIYYSCLPTVVMNQVDIPGLYAVQSHADMIHPSLITQMIQSKLSSTDTGSSVLDWSAVLKSVLDSGVKFEKLEIQQSRYNILRDREFGQVVTNHLRLDFDLVELLSGVDTDNAANHFWNNDHVSQVSLDQIGLLVWLSLLLGLTELLDETHRLALQTAVEPTTSTSVDDIAELVRGEVEESIRRI